MLTRARQSAERLGRRFLVSLLSLLLGVRRRPVQLPESPNILVVRLDERVGNLLLLVPLLDSLRKRYPSARIDLLGNARNQAMMELHPTLDRFLPFRKRALLASDGPLRAPFRLRRHRYDLAIDAANPTDPSATQSILVRLAGAKNTVGVAHDAWRRLYSAPVTIPDPEAHEIDLRLELLTPLPGEQRSRRVFLGELPAVQPESPARELLDALRGERFAVLNVGARLPEKQFDAATYADLGRTLHLLDLRVVVTWGPREKPLAEAVVAAEGRLTLAPATDLLELATLMRSAAAVVTCDTGPMHVAVAVGTPTCGLFVSTPPSRYGYTDPPNAAIDAREAEPEAWQQQVRAWARELPGGGTLH